LSNEAIQVGICWPFNIKTSPTDIIDGFVIKHNCDIRVIQKRGCGKDGVVWLDDGGGDLWGWVDSESEF